ncbi:MAG: hypothetical protein KatS3mg082_0959 [Nitrospiraceae bacterium]|jgi:hypothetical protein|nr:MAG: hypothetical protein KatS3mg082_0959 [Nitrospiraceae bacterium]
MEIEGKFTVKKREDGRFDVSFEPKEEGQAPKRSRSFSSYDGMRRYLLDLGVKSDKIPALPELRSGQTTSISDVKVESSRIAA